MRYTGFCLRFRGAHRCTNGSSDARDGRYETCAEPAVEDVLKGYNGTIFACESCPAPSFSECTRGHTPDPAQRALPELL